MAIPVCQGRVSPVLDVAARLLLVRVEKGAPTEHREIMLTELPPMRLAAAIAELGINALICGAVSQPLACFLADTGVRVVPHVCGETEAVLRAFLSGTLNRPEFRMPGCGGSCCGWHRGRRFRGGRGGCHAAPMSGGKAGKRK